MDFSLGEQLEAVRDLAREIVTDHAAPERLRATETSGTRVDAKLWDELARAGLLATPLAEEDGGAGLGPAALCVLLQEQGRGVAPVPVWPHLTGALALAAYGTPEQRRTHLPSLADGTARVTAALEEFGHEPRGAGNRATGHETPAADDAPTAAPAAQPPAPRTEAVADGPHWRLSGVKAAVPSPSGAGHVLVTAATGAGTGLFLVAADGAGVHWEYAETTSHDRAAHLTLEAAPAAPVGAPGSGAAEWTVQLASVALSALQLGVAESALAYAVSHLSTRQQFGRPLGTFQAVRHQLADCSIDLDAMRVTLWQAVTALEDGEGAAPAALVAKWWADEGGLDVLHRVQHVHGGLGVDTDYPVHRHFLWARQTATTLGGAEAGLAALGDVLAAGAREAVA